MLIKFSYSNTTRNTIWKPFDNNYDEVLQIIKILYRISKNYLPNCEEGLKV